MRRTFSHFIPHKKTKQNEKLFHTSFPTRKTKNFSTFYTSFPTGTARRTPQYPAGASNGVTTNACVASTKNISLTWLKEGSTRPILPVSTSLVSVKSYCVICKMMCDINSLLYWVSLCIVYDAIAC